MAHKKLIFDFQNSLVLKQNEKTNLAYILDENSQTI